MKQWGFIAFIVFILAVAKLSNTMHCAVTIQKGKLAIAWQSACFFFAVQSVFKDSGSAYYLLGFEC